ncbi:MAG: hypothetical protein R3E50_02295 [Halioglobus sp.]
MMIAFGIPASDVARKIIDAIRHNRREVIVGGGDAQALWRSSASSRSLSPPDRQRHAKHRKKIYAGEWWSQVKP